MIRHANSIVFLAILAFMGACRSSPHSDSLRFADAAMPTLDNGYGLLYSTLRDECDVDTVLILTSPTPPATELMKAMGTFSRDTKAGLQGLSNKDSAMALDTQGFATLEDKSRPSLSSVTSTRMLFHGGTKLESRLLLIRHEVLNSTTHLSPTPADQAPRETRTRSLTHISKHSDVSHEQVLALRETPYIGSSK